MSSRRLDIDLDGRRRSLDEKIDFSEVMLKGL
jgi:hypothetical protein